MPTYLIKNSKTEETKEVFMSYGTLQHYLSLNPEWTQIHKSFNIVSEHGDFFSRVPDSFNDHLKGIKKGSGVTNTIKTK